MKLVQVPSKDASIRSDGAFESIPRLARRDVLVVTSWYQTPDHPFAAPFIRDHLSAWVDHAFDDDGTALAVIHPIEALSVLSALKHRRRPLRRVLDEGAWRVVQIQPWRVRRRWSSRDAVSETASLRTALEQFPQFANRPPRLIVAQTLSAARIALQARTALGWRAPVVLVEHSAPLEMQFQVPAAAQLQRRALCDVEAVIAVSAMLAESIVAIRGDRDVHVVENPVDPVVFQMPYPPTWEGGRLRLVNVGFCTEQKAQEVLVRSVPALVERGFDVEAEIVGGGPAFAALEGEVARLGLGDRVHLRGSQPRSEALAALARAHVFVFPSRWENCPVALEEAQAVGLPVVVARNGASERILVHADSRTCPVDDAEALAVAVEGIVTEPHQITAEARRAMAWNRFAPERFADQCMRVFATALERAT